MNNKELAMQYAKDIIIAKLSCAAPTQTDATVGKNIGNMYEAIYNKVYEIASKEAE